MPIDFGADCRPLFSIESDLIFLNNGSFGAPPHSMLEAQATYRAMAERSPISFFRNKLPKYLREAAGDLGAFIGAAEGTLAFTENATTGINSVVLSVAHSLRPGDILLTTDHVYGAVRQTLNRYAEWTGAKVVEVSVPAEGSRGIGADRPVELPPTADVVAAGHRRFIGRRAV